MLLEKLVFIAFILISGGAWANANVRHMGAKEQLYGYLILGIGVLMGIMLHAAWVV